MLMSEIAGGLLEAIGSLTEARTSATKPDEVALGFRRRQGGRMLIGGHGDRVVRTWPPASRTTVAVRAAFAINLTTNAAAPDRQVALNRS
jgi:hypothetical protein